MAVVQHESRRTRATDSGRPATAATPSGSTPTGPGIYRWLITYKGRTVRNGVAPNREEAAAAVSDALDELPRQKPDTPL
jgi:hypothetical protein